MDRSAYPASLRVIVASMASAGDDAAAGYGPRHCCDQLYRSSASKRLSIGYLAA
jgi:hypothetical protein